MSLTRIDRLLANMGFCTRTSARRFLRKHDVRAGSKLITSKDGEVKVDPQEVTIAGKPLDYISPVHLVIHKPKGYVCSRVRDHHDTKLVFDLLPERFFKYKNPCITYAGRLDKFVSGLVIMSQSGQLIQRLTSPKAGVVMGKVYEVAGYLPFTGSEASTLSSGSLQLRNEKSPLRPANFEVIDSKKNLAKITLFEGRYHQLTRMLAALGNKAKSIHRVQIGPISLGDMKPGQWRELTQLEYDAVMHPLKYCELEEEQEQAQEDEFLQALEKIDIKTAKDLSNYSEE